MDLLKAAECSFKGIRVVEVELAEKHSLVVHESLISHNNISCDEELMPSSKQDQCQKIALMKNGEESRPISRQYNGISSHTPPITKGM